MNVKVERMGERKGLARYCCGEAKTLLRLTSIRVRSWSDSGSWAASTGTRQVSVRCAGRAKAKPARRIFGTSPFDEGLLEAAGCVTDRAIK